MGRSQDSDSTKTTIGIIHCTDTMAVGIGFFTVRDDNGVALLSNQSNFCL